MPRTPHKLLDNLAGELWEMRKKYKDAFIVSSSLNQNIFWFDYPDYCGLSYKIKSRLSGDFVDSLQSELFYRLENERLPAYKEIFRSRRNLRRYLLKVWKIYSN
jgi:hypothetical protein